MDAQDFINASSFKIDESITIPPLNPDKVSQGLDLTEATIGTIESDVLDSMFEASSISDESDGPRYPSYQPLNEAALSVGGKNSVTSAIASNTNNSIGIQGPALEFLGETAKFAEGTDFDLTQETADEIKKAQEILATGTLGIANTAEKGNAGIKWSTSGHFDVGANLITMSTDGTLHWNSPVISSVASVQNHQAKAHQVTADVKTSNVKNKYEHIEKTKTSISGDTTNVTINGRTDVANSISQKAVQEHKVVTARAKVDAAELIDYNSQADTRITSKGAIHQQSSAISFAASKGSKSPAGEARESPGLEGETTVNSDGTNNFTVKDAFGALTTFVNVDFSTVNLASPGWLQSEGQLEGAQLTDVAPVDGSVGDGSFTLTADSGVTMAANDIISSAKQTIAVLSGSNMTMAAQGGLSQVAKSMAVVADTALQLEGKNMMSLKSGSKSMVIANGFFFLGQSGVSSTNVPSLNKAKPIEARDIPELPKLPKGITTEQLESCIPDKYKPKPNDNEGVDPEQPETNNAPTKEDAGQREKTQPIPTGKESGTISEGNMGEGQPDSAIEDAQTGTPRDSKMSKNSPISAPDPNNTVGAGAVIEGGSDIFAPTEEEANPTTPTDKEIIDPDSDSDTNTSPGGVNTNADTTPQEVEVLEERKEDYSQRVQVAIENVFDNLKGDFRGILSDLNISNDSRRIIIELQEEIRSYFTDTFKEGIVSTTLPPIPANAPYKPSIDLLLNLDNGVGRAFLERLYTKTVEKLSVGGFLAYVNKAQNYINDQVNVVTNNINDIAGKDVRRITKTAKDVARYIPGSIGDKVEDILAQIPTSGNEVFSDIENLINNTGNLSEIYSTIKTFIDNKELVNQTLDAISTVRLSQEIEDIIKSGIIAQVIVDPADDVGINNIVSTLTTEFISVREDPDYEEDGLSDEVVARAIDRARSTLLNVGRQGIQDIYNKVRPTLVSILTTDVEDVLTGQALENLLPFIIGQENAQVFFDIKKIYFNSRQLFNDVVDLGNDAISQGRSIYQQGQELYTVAKAVPAFVGLMNEYKVPALNQVQTILQCFDLLNQFKDVYKDINNLIKTAKKFADPLSRAQGILDDLFSLFGDGEEESINNPLGVATNNLLTGTVDTTVSRLSQSQDIQNTLGRANTPNEEEDLTEEQVQELQEQRQQSVCGDIFAYSADTAHSDNPDDWSDTVTNEDIIKIIETLPRLTQIFNSVKELPDATVNTLFSSEISSGEIADIKNTTINVSIDNCYVAPRLNLAEALVEVIEIKNNLMLFRMENIDLLKFNGKNILPSENTIIQIYAEKFFNSKTGQDLFVSRTPEFFSPLVYNFKVADYKQDRNIGIAQLIPTQSFIYLEDLGGATFSYSITNIGNKLNPDILDAYVLL